MRHLVPAYTLASLIALAGCVGAPAPGPVGYAPPPYAAPGYAAPGYTAPGYAQPVVPGGYAASPGLSQGYAPGAPAGAQVALGATCYAGVYTCPVPQALPVGAQCSCPGLGAPSYGTVR